jgi:hypothetical protein
MPKDNAVLYVNVECKGECQCTNMMEAGIYLEGGGATLRAYCPECDYVYENTEFLCEF